jgi:hypothetical protein
VVLLVVEWGRRSCVEYLTDVCFGLGGMEGEGGRREEGEEGRRMAVRKKCGFERRAHSLLHVTFLNCVRRITLGFLEPGSDTSGEGWLDPQEEGKPLL